MELFFGPYITIPSPHRPWRVLSLQQCLLVKYVIKLYETASAFSQKVMTDSLGFRTLNDFWVQLSQLLRHWCPKLSPKDFGFNWLLMGVLHLLSLKSLRWLMCSKDESHGPGQRIKAHMEQRVDWESGDLGSCTEHWIINSIQQNVWWYALDHLKMGVGFRPFCESGL